ncbi:MAG: hypothetical protein EXX96DRAFT_94759 [Benjaminiella poitrasii]|nr:MAG: hypothetical protein EXX96DRAFT_94759 [Benjaminiella poitrasii]
MATKRKGKTVPCEGCRERKKKCTAGQPCERCKRLGIECYYLKPVAPPKIEYIEAAFNQELHLHVKQLEETMRNLEKEMTSFRSPLFIKQDKKDDNSDDDFETDTFPSSSINDRLTKYQNAANNWQLTFNKNGSISIHTGIQSYSNLLNHIKALGTTSNFTPPIIKQPTLASFTIAGGYLKRNGLNSTLRKGNFIATIRTVRNLKHNQQDKLLLLSSPSMSQSFSPSSSYICLQDPEVTIMMQAESKPPDIVYERENLALELINSYFSCCFLDRVVFHQKTFFDMFVNNNNDIESSPVVYALCATVLVIHCKHILAIVPYDQQFALGEYYFDKARSLIAMQFDEVSLETMITYLYMSLYKGKILQPKASYMYLEIAIRIRQILIETDYKALPITESSMAIPLTSIGTNGVKERRPVSRAVGEYEMFVRLHAAFMDATQFIQFINNQRGIPFNGKTGGPKLHMKFNDQLKTFLKTFYRTCQDLYSPRVLADESQQMVRAIMKEYFLARTGKIMGPYIFRLRFSDNDLVPISLVMKTEQDIKNFYYRQMPTDYQLDDAIFEDGISDTEFKKRIREDKRCDIVSVSLAAQLYQSLIALHEPYLPVFYAPPALTDLVNMQGLPVEVEPDEKYVNKRKRDATERYPTPEVSTASEEEDGKPDALHIYALRAQNICYKSAINVVRLLEYLCTELESCSIPQATLLCAWDILMRNSCLGMSDNDLEEAGVTKFMTKDAIQLSREYALRCIDVLRRGYMFNSAEKGILEYYKDIERQLLTTLCKPASSTAKYWEPVSTW